MTVSDQLNKQCLKFDENIDLDKPIYRTMPIERFIQILESKKLTLIKPKKWEDPFENAFLLSNFRWNGGTATLGPRDTIYGLCWTLHEESDAMWRIYSHDKRGLTVKTTPRKLLNALMAIDSSFSTISCFIGKVDYLSKQGIHAEYKKLALRLKEPNGKALIESLLYKRETFKHENEVRLLYFTNKDSSKNDIFQFDINPNDLFDQVMFDPRLDQSIYELYEKWVLSYSFSGRIIKSSLYDMPEKITYLTDL